MLDRESSFADPEVIATLRERFVPLALDVWYEARREDARGELFRRIALHREGMSLDRTTQGLYAFAPDGTLLQGWNHRGVERMKEHLGRALEAWKALASADASKRAGASEHEPAAASDARFDRAPPDGAIVVAVRARVLLAEWPEVPPDLEGPYAEWARIVQRATSLDHLWILREEVAALAAGTFPRSLAWRIARFHAVDDTRGEPPSWEPEAVKQCEATLARDGSVDGAFALAAPDGALAFDARLGGVVTVREGRLERFDLAIRGDFLGQGPFTQGAPPGRFPLAVVLSLARDGDHPEVPPQGARWLDDYLGRVKGRDGK